jgi:Tfp pilus assembly protein PilX
MNAKHTCHSLHSRTGRHPGCQRGAVLIFALIVLVIMTILAISGIGNSTLEQRMSSNYTQSATAFQAAEQALREAEEWLYAKNASDATFKNMDASTWWFKSTTVSDGLYTAMYADPDGAKVCKGVGGCEFDPRDESQWCSDMSSAGSVCKLPKGYVTLGTTLKDKMLSPVGQDLNGDGTIDSVAQQPRFIIEYIGPRILSNVLNYDSQNVIPPLQAFRITVIAWGRDASTHRVLQSHVVLVL